MKKFVTSDSANPEFDMLFQAANDNNGGGGKQHITHEEYKTLYGPYGTYTGYVTCMFCWDEYHWGYPYGNYGRYCDCYDECHCDDDCHCYDNCDCHYDCDCYGYDCHCYDGCNCREDCECHYYEKIEGYEGQFGICLKCQSPCCKRLRKGKGGCDFEFYDKNKSYKYFSKEALIKDLKEWCRVHDPYAPSLPYNENYVEANIYFHTDGTYTVCVHPSAIEGKTPTGITITTYYPDNRVEYSFNGEPIDGYAHTHRYDKKASDGEADGKLKGLKYYIFYNDDFHEF